MCGGVCVWGGCVSDRIQNDKMGIRQTSTSPHFFQICYTIIEVMSMVLVYLKILNYSVYSGFELNSLL